MADKGFDIQNDLKKLDLLLNIPPFLKDKVGFEEDDVIKTQTIARHRIRVEGNLQDQKISYLSLSNSSIYVWNH